MEELAMALPVLRRSRGDQAPASWRESEQRGPWAEFNELYEQMGQLLSEVWGSGADRDGGGWRPAADVEETADDYLVELELPGVKQENISVEFGGGELAVTGEVKERQRVGFLRTQTRRVGRFDYRVSLPADIEEDQVSASLSNGVLTVRVPKTAKSRPRKIQITS
jgi:HSP20 family protein